MKRHAPIDLGIVLFLFVQQTLTTVLCNFKIRANFSFNAHKQNNANGRVKNSASQSDK